MGYKKKSPGTPPAYLTLKANHMPGEYQATLFAKLRVFNYLARTGIRLLRLSKRVAQVSRPPIMV
jgi:hypothetical protein